jgi:uncharacterized protein (DUF608 family)
MKTYTGRNLDLISYPMGGIGAGMVCLQGTGSLGNVSVRNKPDYTNDPLMFSAITVLGREPVSRVVEAPVPDPNFFMKIKDSGNGLAGKSYGLPRFSNGEFSARFPFASVKLTDSCLPITAELTGWSPFIPNDEDRSSLPMAALEYTFTNTSADAVDAVYYFCAANFMKLDDNARVRAVPNGFILDQPEAPASPAVKGAFCASTAETSFVDTAWFRGGWFDPLTLLWKSICDGDCANKRYPDPENGQSSGGTLAIPFALAPGQSKTIRLHLSWYVPGSDVQSGEDAACCSDGCCCKKAAPSTYRPWYASRFSSIDEVNNSWLENADTLKEQTMKFTQCFYDSTLPDEILDAIAANLCILKSPTVLRQFDGRLWGWEGCCDNSGCCSGSCTHVWNYAQAICHLFPRLERSLRETEYLETQNADGHQNFRAYLPIRKTTDHSFHAASDGQLGGVIKVYRDWHISGDTAWLKSIWPSVRLSLDYCISLWDTDREGILKQPHHNTYDIEFWGPDGMCGSFYLGALKAACEMGAALGDDCAAYEELYQKGRVYLETKLFNGEYFYQQVQRDGLNTTLDLDSANAETRVLLEQEGPKYQYGTGCLSDGVLGAWLSEVCGLAPILNDQMLKTNLRSIYQYNFKKDLSAHANPQRPGFAAKHDAGLLLCTWPHGGKPSLPFVYCDEVFTGIEYQVASHLISKGMVQEGLEIVRGCRSRYDGTVRNPYNEYECGHWYARAMASYALLQAYTGVRYDALTRTLTVSTANSSSYRTFLATATGYGTVEVRNGQLKVDAVAGAIKVDNIVWVSGC